MPNHYPESRVQGSDLPNFCYIEPNSKKCWASLEQFIRTENFRIVFETERFLGSFWRFLRSNKNIKIKKIKLEKIIGIQKEK